MKGREGIDPPLPVIQVTVAVNSHAATVCQARLLMCLQSHNNELKQFSFQYVLLISFWEIRPQLVKSSLRQA